LFRCQLCNQNVPPRTPQTRIVVETRPVEYPRRAKAHRVHIDGRAHEVDDPGGTGTAIVRECIACPSCAFNAAARPRSHEHG
jgi:hypothetical protein